MKYPGSWTDSSSIISSTISCSSSSMNSCAPIMRTSPSRVSGPMETTASYWTEFSAIWLVENLPFHPQLVRRHPRPVFGGAYWLSRYLCCHWSADKLNPRYWYRFEPHSEGELGPCWRTWKRWPPTEKWFPHHWLQHRLELVPWQLHLRSFERYFRFCWVIDSYWCTKSG